jgi:hypothetical protein
MRLGESMASVSKDTEMKGKLDSLLCISTYHL